LLSFNLDIYIKYTRFQTEINACIAFFTRRFSEGWLPCEFPADELPAAGRCDSPFSFGSAVAMPGSFPSILRPKIAVGFFFVQINLLGTKQNKVSSNLTERLNLTNQ